MQTEFNEIASIEAFLDGTLMDEAKDAFEVWRKQDPDSESKIEAQQVLRDGMYALAVESYKDQLREWNEADKLSKAPITTQRAQIGMWRKNRSTWISLAVATFFVCLFLWLGTHVAKQEYSDKALAEANYIQPIFPSENKIGQINLDDCPAVIRSEIRSAKKNPARDAGLETSLLFFKGHCLYQSGDYLDAATAFQQALSQESSELQQSPNAYWHLVLALIASDQISDQQAIDLLDQLPAHTPLPLQQKAATLKEKLHSNWRWLAS